MKKTVEPASTGQVTANAAEIYDAFFVPALFGEWAGPLCATAQLAAGNRVLDIACGTGATTRAAQAIVGLEPLVTGLDCNAGMLRVARMRAPNISWVDGRAEALPFADASFDAALCQFGLMFFEDKVAALREMTRVVRPGGRIALSVWDDVRNSPGYARMIALLERLFGTEVADALRAPFVLGCQPVLRRLLDKAGLADAAVETRTGSARFPSMFDWVRMDVRGWTLTDMIDDDQFDVLVRAAERELSGFVGPDGRVAFASPAHIASFTVG